MTSKEIQNLQSDLDGEHWETPKRTISTNSPSIPPTSTSNSFEPLNNSDHDDSSVDSTSKTSSKSPKDTKSHFSLQQTSTTNSTASNTPTVTMDSLFNFFKHLLPIKNKLLPITNKLSTNKKSLLFNKLN